MEGITTGKNVPTGKKIELTKEQKKAQTIADAKTLISYNFQVDNLSLEINKIEEILRLDLANRELKENLKAYKEQLTRFKNLIKVLHKRMRK